MANVISILNPKGGAGKTTIAIHVAKALSLAGESVVLVDSDPQGSARDWSQAADGGAGFPVVGIDRPNIDKEVPGLGEGRDWIIIDGAAKLEAMSASAVKASDLVVIPVQPSGLDIWACSSLIDMIKTRHTLTDGNPVTAFQITRAKKGTQLAREANDAIAEFGFPVLNGAIYDRTVYAKSITEGKTAYDIEADDGPARWEIDHLVRQLKEAFE